MGGEPALPKDALEEERQFSTAENIHRYLAVDDVLAWRVLYLTMLGHETPDMPCIAIFESDKWQALYCFIRPVHHLMNHLL